MITLEIPETNRTMYLPEHLGECEKSQYIAVSELIYRYNHQLITFDSFKDQAFFTLLNLKQPKQYSSPEAEEEKNANIALHANLIESFFEEGEKGPTIRQEYTKSHIDFVQPLWHKYYGPTDDFNNIKFGEYTDAINLFLEYEATKEDIYLRLIMAILFRKKRKFHKLKNFIYGKKTDVREYYNEDTVDQRAKVFEGLSKGELYGFYLYLASFHKYLTNCTLQLNGNQIHIGMLFQESKEKQVESKLPGLGLKSIEYQISESGVFGSNKEVRNTSLWEILIRLYDITKRDKDEKARQKAAEAEAKQKNKSK